VTSREAVPRYFRQRTRSAGRPLPITGTIPLMKVKRLRLQREGITGHVGCGLAAHRRAVGEILKSRAVSESAGQISRGAAGARNFPIPVQSMAMAAHAPIPAVRYIVGNTAKSEGVTLSQLFGRCTAWRIVSRKIKNVSTA
jgi:hypothetical protein